MNRTDAALYLSAISVLLALHITAPIIVAFITGALLIQATRQDDLDPTDVESII